MFEKPRIVISRCLGFDHCRYDGAMIDDPFAALLRDHAECIPVCPEMEIDLGIPRAPIRVVLTEGGIRLVQPSTGRDFTTDMETFAIRFQNSLPEIDGFLLKGRSPSCGVRDTKVFIPNGGVIEKSAGFFARAVMARFPGTALEDEARMTDPSLREHYLVRVFTAARFRAARASGSMEELIRFQAENKLLLMAYSQRITRELGRIAGNPDRLVPTEVIAQYGYKLLRAFSRPAVRTAHINVIMHALGYFSDRLTSDEKKCFLDAVERFRNRGIPLSAITGIIQAWIARFGEPYLAKQTYFAPFPEVFAEHTASGMGAEECIPSAPQNPQGNRRKSEE